MLRGLVIDSRLLPDGSIVANGSLSSVGSSIYKTSENEQLSRFGCYPASGKTKFDISWNYSSLFSKHRVYINGDIIQF